MPAPTLSNYQQSDWTDSSLNNEVTASATWSSGDVIVVLGMTSDDSATLGVPTASGLTFSALGGSPTSLANTCKAYGWSATAGSSGSGAITSTSNALVFARGIAAFVFTGSGGVGNLSIAAGLGSTTTQSLVRGSNNSAVVQAWGDWNAVNDVIVAGTPSGETQRVAQFVSGQATFFVFNWGDQGTAGTTSYGMTGSSATAMSAITVEVKGSAAASAPFPPFDQRLNLVRF